MEKLFEKTLKEIKENRKKGKKSELNEWYNKLIIYKWDINNKSYIGLTTNLKVRLKNYLSNSSNDHYISRAIKKYPDEEIIFSIVCLCNTLEELKNSEKYYIDFYNTMENGYNLTTGGEHSIFSEETIEKMKSSAKNKKEVYFFNNKTKEIEFIFESVREAARKFETNSSNIFNAITKKYLFKSLYKVSYIKNDPIFFEEKIHKNKEVMANNKNANKYEWILEFDDGRIYKEISLRELYLHCQFVKESTFRRIAENKMKDLSKYNFKILKNELKKN